MSSRVKISIIGAGYVGSTAAYALMTAGLASEIVIVDLNKEKAEGEAMDLSHGAAFVKPVDIRSGEYSDTKDSNIVIVSAGSAQKAGETRLDLIEKNYKIFSSIIPEIVKYSPNSILLIVSNPVDILSYIAYKLSGFPKERVIGSGTVLDTARLRYMLAEHFGLDARNVHTYILGEHGDSEIAAWSITSIAGMNVNDFCSLNCNKCDGNFKYTIGESVKNAAYEIIKRKGATYYAVGLAIKRIVEAILRDENSILTVSTLLESEYGIENTFLGIPCIIGSKGIKKILNVPLSDEELSMLQSSGKTLSEALSLLDKN